MKKQVLLLLSLSVSPFMFSQWADQATGFGTASRGINSISIIDANTVWAGAYDGTNTSNYITDFTKTTNGGTNWSAGTITTGLSGVGLANISAINGDTAWACIFHPTQAVAGGIWKTTNGGGLWTQQTSAAFTAGGFPDFVYFWDRNNGIAVGDPTSSYFEVYTTGDGGSTWTRTANTGNQLQVSSAAEYGYTNGFSVIGGTLWFGTTNGRVFKTTDKGFTFTVASVGNGITDVQKISFADANTGYAGVHNAGNLSYKLAKTFDGGNTWFAVNSGTNIMGGDFCAVPGTSSIISVGSDATVNGSTWSNDNGSSWTLMEDTTISPQRLSVRFLDATTGWAGGFNTDAFTGGISKFTSVVGINDKESATLKTVNLYPNPVNDKLSIRFGGFSNTEVSVKIFSLTGQLVLQEKIVIQNAMQIKQSDVSSLVAGLYFAEVTDGAEKLIQRFIKQ